MVHKQMCSMSVVLTFQRGGELGKTSLQMFLRGEINHEVERHCVHDTLQSLSCLTSWQPSTPWTILSFSKHVLPLVFVLSYSLIPQITPWPPPLSLPFWHLLSAALESYRCSGIFSVLTITHFSGDLSNSYGCWFLILICSPGLPFELWTPIPTCPLDMST